MAPSSCKISCVVVVLFVAQVAAHLDDVIFLESSSSTISLSRERRELNVAEESHESSRTDSGNLQSRDYVRTRRNAFLQLPPTHLIINNLRANQRCHGNLLEWIRPKLPFSPTSHYENAEFIYYNVYRSVSYFTSVASLKPYASGKTYADLRNLSFSKWLDRDPLPNVVVWYAVTVVSQAGKEHKDVTPAKVMYVGAFGASGARVPLTPNNVRGKSLHHSVVYNKPNNRYMVVYDVDTNGDNAPDRIYAVQLSPTGQIVGGKVLDVTANVKGIQGWPEVSHNPISNEYLVVFIVKSPSLFSGKAVLVGQRIKTHVTQRVVNPSLLLKANEFIKGKEVFIPLSNHQVFHNPSTGGYNIVSELTSSARQKGIVMQSLDSKAKAIGAIQIYNSKVNARSARGHFDTRWNEIYVTAVLPAKAINNRKFAEPFVIAVTKYNATGKPLTTGKVHLIAGTTNYIFTEITGFYSKVKDRVVLYWEALEARKRVIRRAEVVINRAAKIEGLKEDKSSTDVCMQSKIIRKPFTTEPDENGVQAIVWEENQSMRWKIGGNLIGEDTFGFKGNQQRKPILAYNQQDKKILVVWQESVSASQVNIYAQHIAPRQPVCVAGCAGKQVCLKDNKCHDLYRDRNPCGLSNGGCSHLCLKRPTGAVCACPQGMKLLPNKRVCYDRDLSNSQYSLVVAAKKRIWHMTKYQDGDVAFQLLPMVAQSIVPVVFDPVDKFLYYSDVDANMIRKTDMTKNIDDLFVSSVMSDGMTIEASLRKLYFTDIRKKTIEVINLDGTNQHVLLSSGLDKPRAVRLHRENGKLFLYWTDWGTTAMVQRGELSNGGNTLKNPVTLISTQLAWPNGIAFHNGNLYIGDAKMDRIESFDTMGRNRGIFVKESEHPFEMHAVNNSLYWSDWSGSIMKKDLRSNRIEPFISGLDRPTAFVFLKREVSLQSSCPDPGVPTNGKRFGSSFQVGKSVTFACSQGYVLSGPIFIKCLSSGTWSNQKPVCKAVTCPQPLKPKNGNVYVTGQNLGDAIVYTCNPGYKMVGSKVRRCQADGTWSESEPTCSVLPVFIKRPQNHTVAVGKHIVLTCEAHGDNIKMQWSKDNRILTSKDTTLRVFVFERSIVLTEVRFSDAGIFKCQVTNGAGTISSSATVKVLGDRIKKCGERKFGTRQRITGGKIAGEGSHPWIAMLYDTKRKVMFCGGTLVSNKWIVTAAHCLENVAAPSDFVVLLGKSHRLKDDPNQQTLNVSGFFKHSDFSTRTYDSDIALIRLDKPALITDYVIPICLPYNDLDFKLVKKFTLVTIAGWGSKNERQQVNKKLAKKLREIEIPIVEHNECQAKLSHPVTKNMVCAGDRSGTDACKGDSGGPMEGYNYETKRHILVGVVSWGDGCGKTDSYGVYTKVQNYLAWINSYMSKS